MRLLSVSFSAAASAVALFSLTHVQAYGTLGHTLTGQIGQKFLTLETARQVEAILDPSYEGLLSKAAPWPDAIKGFDRYKWASVLHYVNSPGDSPPDRCVSTYDFAGLDIVNGLFNMTATMKHFKDQPPTTTGEASILRDALRFFVHFVGDIHQPLHDSGKDRGGNDAPIKFGKTKSNLHSMWDTLIITKDVKDRFGNDPKAYLDDTLSLASQYWKPESLNWTDCDASNFDVQNPWSNTTNNIKKLCPIEWARTMNALDCTYVWKDYSPTRDYSTDYFKQVTGPASQFLVQKLLAMSGIRMAAVLNEIYDPAGASSVPEVVKREESPKLSPRYLRLLEDALAN
ncbi:hypothetical protein BGZ82_007192 [Podila clonocystis]|nr:hypothetical protein BGZ82_007192 [Podila clonocystis]